MRTGAFTWLSILASLAVLGAGGGAEAAGIEAPAAPALAPAPRPPLGTTTLFPYEQQRLLVPGNGSGGLAYVTSGADAEAKLPVVVFLHGMNAYGHMHMGFGAPFTDLRTVVDGLVLSGRVGPLVLAAPTHTRSAFAARRMWPDFDLSDFLDATEAALGESAHIDRSRVVVVAHSGGGCNPGGGIFASSVRRASPLAVVAVDTCLYEDVIPELASLAEAVPVRFYWQRAWARPVDELVEACPTCAVEELTDLAPKPSPHVTILPDALDRALPTLLAPP
jgi:predicted dienelactone hydrolase